MAADDDKKLILARRAKFVAAALAGVSVACGKEPNPPPPQPCLSVPMERRDAEPEPPPMPCLTPVMQESIDAGPPAESDAGKAADGGLTTRSQSPDASTPPPKPTPCLVPPAPSPSPTKPMPCLTPVRPPDKGAK